MPLFVLSLNISGYMLHFYTCYLAYQLDSLGLAVASFFLPGLANLYWMNATWDLTGEFLNLYTSLNLTWILCYLYATLIRGVPFMLDGVVKEDDSKPVIFQQTRHEPNLSNSIPSPKQFSDSQKLGVLDEELGIRQPKSEEKRRRIAQLEPTDVMVEVVKMEPEYAGWTETEEPTENAVLQSFICEDGDTFYIVYDFDSNELIFYDDGTIKHPVLQSLRPKAATLQITRGFETSFLEQVFLDEESSTNEDYGLITSDLSNRFKKSFSEGDRMWVRFSSANKIYELPLGFFD